MTTELELEVRSVAKALEEAWNAGSGEGFARPFAADADFVDIRGDHHHGREAIANGHQAIFDTVYRGTTVVYEVVAVRDLGDVRIVHCSAELRGAENVLPPNNGSIFSMVLVKDGNWQIVSFHNTLRMKPQN